MIKAKKKKRAVRKKKTTKKKRPKKKPKKSADPGKGVKKPRNRDKALSAAYLRLLGASQKQTAHEAGVAERQLREWEKSDWWPDFTAEARQRWLRGGDSAAMRGILKALGEPSEYAQMSRYWADRRIPELAPPKVRKEHTGPDAGPIKFNDDSGMDLTKLSDKELDDLERLSKKAAKP